MKNPMVQQTTYPLQMSKWQSIPFNKSTWWSFKREQIKQIMNKLTQRMWELTSLIVHQTTKQTNQCQLWILGKQQKKPSKLMRLWLRWTSYVMLQTRTNHVNQPLQERPSNQTHRQSYNMQLKLQSQKKRSSSELRSRFRYKFRQLMQTKNRWLFRLHQSKTKVWSLYRTVHTQNHQSFTIWIVQKNE